MSRIIKKTGALTNPYPTQDPFLFAVYHWDKYPAGDDKMRAPRRGNGSDFDWSKPYRMYHGDEHPGCKVKLIQFLNIRIEASRQLLAPWKASLITLTHLETEVDTATAMYST